MPILKLINNRRIKDKIRMEIRKSRIQNIDAIMKIFFYSKKIIDTHKKNLSMRAAIEKFGFQFCGNIYVRNGSERIAYDYQK